MLYLLQNLLSIPRLAFHKLLSKFHKPTLFQIGIAEKYFETDTNKFTYLKNSSESYLADPFIFQRSTKSYVFCEKYNKVLKKGFIEVFEISDDYKFIDLGIALEKDFHLSFPFVFQFRDNIYMIPESKSAEKITLYKNIKWPNEWQETTVLVDGVKAVDSIILKHKDTWWLLTTFDSSGTNMSQSELHVYFSSELESNNWTKHRKNPVIIDSYKGRNSGFFYDKNRLIRCSQSMINYKYGSKLNFHEITELSEQEYVEVDLDLGIFDNYHSYDTKNGISVLDRRV